jgi:hypothetical protein
MIGMTVVRDEMRGGPGFLYYRLSFHSNLDCQGLTESAAEDRCGQSGGDYAWDVDWICCVIISFNTFSFKGQNNLCGVDA